MYGRDQNGPFALLTPKPPSSDMAQQNEGASVSWRERGAHQRFPPSGPLATTVELFCS